MSKDKKQKCCYIPERRGKVGGQAVLEGVMMKSGERVALTVRKDDGTKETKISKFVSIRKKNKFFNLPIVRGVVNFIEMMKLSFSTLNDSAEMLGIDEEMEETKFEKWLKKHFGKSVMDFIMLVAMVLGIALALFLFMFLPTFFTGLIERFTGDLGLWKSVIEGGFKVAIFVGYMLLVSLMKDIRRTFEFHGAEHKSIFCYEAGEELTVENVKKHSRFHPRCGTSFMFVMILLTIVVGLFITWENKLLRVAIKILLMPIVMGVGYEFLMYAGKHDNFLIRALSAPGLWMQRITTKEPDEEQIECAIMSLKAALPDEFPPEETGACTEEDGKDGENNTDATE
ncbi:MAG: DUF1385 domain-containing protein [Ruminococcaceae bacterium]|nr:DUF1385 domain-containing protein [Oscillospiraceae bacterium]